MTDWGAHTFGGALFACNLHTTGPVEIYPPDGKAHEFLTYVFANGIRIYHRPNGPQLEFRGTKATIKSGDAKKIAAPNIAIPNYHGGARSVLGDFLHCVKTRQKPFRYVETVHRTVSHCHLGNLAYWLNRPLKWDPAKEEFINDSEANRWISRPKRAPWNLV